MVMVAPETGFWSLPWMVTRNERRNPSCALEAQQKSANRASSTNPRKALRKCKVENCKCMTKQRLRDPRRYRQLSKSVQHKPQRFKQIKKIRLAAVYSTTTDFDRFRGWSTLWPQSTAMW